MKPNADKRMYVRLYPLQVQRLRALMREYRSVKGRGYRSGTGMVIRDAIDHYYDCVFAAAISTQGTSDDHD